jgi:hypothetical protein
MIGDKAFEQLELYDFVRHSKSGECIEVLPQLRKTVRRTKEEINSGTSTSAFAVSSVCVP